jgi:hypothetical protein
MEHGTLALPSDQVLALDHHADGAAVFIVSAVCPRALPRPAD